MKKKIVALLAVGGSVASAFAEGTSSTMDVTAASGMVESAKNGLTTLLTTCTPYVTALFLAGLAIWGAFVVFKLIKRAFSRAA